VCDDGGDDSAVSRGAAGGSPSTDANGKPSADGADTTGDNNITSSGAGSYNKSASTIEATLSASAAPVDNKTASSPTSYFGFSGSFVTPVGGADISFGLYQDSYGFPGSYLSLGPALGTPSVSVGIISGHSTNFSGQSLNLSAGGAVVDLGISRSVSINPSSGETTGNSWTFGLSLGPPVAVSASNNDTATSEFTSIYKAYIDFLNWVGYKAPM
jgi:hypothetical protein